MANDQDYVDELERLQDELKRSGDMIQRAQEALVGMSPGGYTVPSVRAVGIAKRIMFDKDMSQVFLDPMQLVRIAKILDEMFDTGRMTKPNPEADKRSRIWWNGHWHGLDAAVKAVEAQRDSMIGDRRGADVALSAEKVIAAIQTQKKQ